MAGGSQRKKTGKRHFGPLGWAGLALLAILGAAQWSVTGSAQERQSAGRAAVIAVRAPLTSEKLAAVERQLDRCVQNEMEAVIFRFEGAPGESFENYRALARRIVRTAEETPIKMVAYVPAEARGMTMLAVLACGRIVADDFAQLGQIVTAEARDQAGLPVDRQVLLNTVAGFAEAGGHDGLLARAMAAPALIVYEIVRNGERRFVDQAGFERLVQAEGAAWRLVGPGPVAVGGEPLLMDGRRGRALGLVADLASDIDDLVTLLGMTLVDVEGLVRAVQIDRPDEVDTAEPAAPTEPRPARAAVITVAGMIDEGLYASMRRRTEEALAGGADYIIYEIDTFGGSLAAAISIWDYLMHEVSEQAHTVAFVPTKAISAGVMIAVACNDIIMKRASVMGDAAPISGMGQPIEGVEREKIESPTRSYFRSAAEANNYPVALCEAFVTMGIEVFQVRNRQTGRMEYFRGDELPDDPYLYDLAGRVRIVSDQELLTVTASEALELGLTRAIVDDSPGDYRQTLAFIAERDQVVFEESVLMLETNWSEDLVRWLSSPMVAGILTMVALLGIYAELNSPGVGLPGAVAVVALLILFGSKYLIGMANWWEISIFILGIGLLAAEIFVIPGFGIAGISGILLIMFALGAMMVTNPPDRFPLPQTDVEWELFEANLIWTVLGIVGFAVLAYFLAKYMPRIPVARRLVLATPADHIEARRGGQPAPAPAEATPVQVGDEGVALSDLRPVGKGRIGDERLDVVARGAYIDRGRRIVVVALDGNSIVVKEMF